MVILPAIGETKFNVVNAGIINRYWVNHHYH